MTSRIQGQQTGPVRLQERSLATQRIHLRWGRLAVGSVAGEPVLSHLGTGLVETHSALWVQDPKDGRGASKSGTALPVASGREGNFRAVVGAS